MKTITKAAWDRVIHKACDVANASVMEDEPMCEVLERPPQKLDNQ
jgi:hypothetical protein